jgi:hypothetical protein
MYACHRCGNQSCCNPSHIYSGSPKQNNEDKKMHGTHKFGETMYSAKLKELDVIRIRNDQRSASKIAQDYNVTASNIAAIKALKTWRHI